MTNQPNILLIFTDQHRLSAVGAYGNTVCRTPHIDRIAAEGVRFTNAYTSAPVCSPARASVMTGQYPHRHGICANVNEIGCSVHELEDRPELLSRKLESAGYRLGYSGKWHLGTENTTLFGGSNRPSLPKNVGFEGQNFPGHGGGGFRYSEYKEYLTRNGFEHQVKPLDKSIPCLLPMGELAGPVESTVDYFITENTLSLIDRFAQKKAPFFIWHNFWGPHEPYYAPKEFIDLYRNIDIPPWPNYHWPSRSIPGPHHAKIHPDQERVTWEDWARVIRHYYASTSLIDSQIGRIIHHLERTDLLKNTIIIFTADHGETLGSHGGLTDKGFHHFDETHKIPLLIRFPEGTAKGKVISELVSLVDIYPTILELAKNQWDPKIAQGMSLLPLVGSDSKNWRDMVVVEFEGVNSVSMTQRTVRWKNLKYGYNCCFQDELYNLINDPYEMNNLINHPDYRQVADDLRLRLMDWMERTEDYGSFIFQRTLDYYQRRNR